MLLVTGSGPTHTMGLGHFQDIDQVALAAPVCRYARMIDRPERIPQFVHEAFTAAMSGRPGPVHLTFPLDIQTAEIDLNLVVRIARPSVTGVLSAGGDPEQIAKAARLIGDAECPLLIAGSGVYYAEGEEALMAFVSAQAIPVVVPIWDRGSVPRPIDEFVGVIGAATGGPHLLHDADLIIMVGAACDYRVGYLQPPAIREDVQIIRIDRDPGWVEQGVGAHLPILGDPRSVLRQLTDACARQGARPHTAWLQEAQARRKAFRERCLDARNRAASGLHALDIIRAVQAVMTDETIVVIDGGNIGQWVHQILCDRYPGHWLTCGASANVGYGLPAAMAARLLYPNRPILLISGDGALTFTIAEFETAARQRLGFVVLLTDDEAWGITLTGHRREFGEGITSELGPIQFKQVAEAFGAYGVRVNHADEIVPAIRQASTSDRPTLIHVPVVRSNPTD
jgi:acetolactate synthase-1/2/3 large subunit